MIRLAFLYQISVKGPALYAYNDAVFTAEDWERIQKAGRSGKLNDPNKIGRFGIGFNSVYHITDVPSIFSSEHLGLLDPQEKIFGDRNGGFLWSLDDAEHQEALMKTQDQFKPFRDIVSVVGKQKWSKIIEDQYFPGTIFRFPLRNEKSGISDNLYNSDKVVELFDSFIADASLSLLFLKSVSSLSLIHIDVDGTLTVRLEIKSSVHTEAALPEKKKSVIEGLTRFKLITHNSEDHNETKWLVTTCTMKEGHEKNLDVLAKKLSFLPRVDLAFPLGEEKDYSGGRLSCFLPLPNNESNNTGLPVHVNACFGLTDNRRHIKWQEEDQKHDEHALWNELLMKEVLPKAYVMIIQDAIKLCQQHVLPVSSVYSLWPDLDRLQHKEKWHTVAMEVFHHLFKQNLPVLSLAKDEKKFICLSEAVLPCNGPTNTSVLAAIERTLVSCGENLVTLQASVVRAIKAFPQTTLKQVTPSYIRKVLHRTGVHNLSREDKLCLLEYILSDGQYKELNGLQLLPLSDGSFRSFTNRDEDTALISSKHFPRTLLPYCKHLFIPHDLGSTCTTHLKELAKQQLFKVTNINADHVVQYTRRFVPQEWKQNGTALVTWNTDNASHPPLEWIQEFWKFLNTHFKELSCLTELPLIPVSPLSVGEPVTLAKLKQNTTLISQKSKQNSLPKQLAQLVSNVGGTVLRGNEWLRHSDLETYVLSPSPRSIINLFMNLDIQRLIRAIQSESQTAREELKNYLSKLNSFSDGERDLLLTLPLFQTMKGSYVTAQSKQALVQTSGPVVPRELPMPDSIIQCVTEADRRLLKLLKLTFLCPAEAGIVLVEKIEKGHCSDGETEKIMTWILQNGNILFSQNQSLKRRCQELRFIKVNGELRKTSGCLDPRVKSFKQIFDSDFFPPPVYTETAQMLESLTDLGLLNKESDLEPGHLLRATTLVEKLQVNSKSDAVNKAQVLLKMLDANDLLSKFSNEQLHHLKMVKWVPCAQPGANNKQTSNDLKEMCFYTPDEIRHTQYDAIVGHVMPLMGNLGDKVSYKLGFKRPPSPEKVIENLSVLKLKARKMHDPDTNMDFKIKLHSIYRHMQENLSSFGKLMDKEPCWLWAHNHFVSPKDLVLNYPANLDLSSYIAKAPMEFLPFKKLLQTFGLRTSLTNEDIVRILHSIQLNVDERKPPVASSDEVKVSIEILNWLWREKQEVNDDIPVPVILKNGHFTLTPRSQALLCDVGINKLTELQFSQEELYILHEEIPIATAEFLQIRFLSNYILAPELVGIEQCGQSEPITLRIKNILKEYDEEGDIFKELIQNAEDAGADACKFLVDFRVHRGPPESLIDPNMALCQGPCLWAFNNEQFTEEDWKNIVRVGSASKEQKREKIGKFGLGFNTVYHITDIPSILSGSSLLILDPNVTHLKKHIQHHTNPGIKLDLSQKRHFNCFPGQFGPFEGIFDCNFTKSPPDPFTGTLIKLPFRSEEEALKSEISTKVYHKHDINVLQQNFTNNSQMHLLFLKNITSLSLQSISNDASTPPRDGEIKTTLTVSKATVNSMLIADGTRVSEQHQAVKKLMQLDSKCKEIIDSSTITIVEVTSQQFGQTEQESWLIYNCFGTAQSLKMALQPQKKVTFCLPIGGIAIPLKKDPQTGTFSPLQTDRVGQTFCFLPLPIHTGLPVNVNGTFAVMSNRKCLWESGVKQEWNMALLQDPATTAYVTALLALKEMSEKKELEAYTYHTFWPEREKVRNNFKPLVDAFYSAIAHPSTGPELFSDGENWCSMNNAIFLHEKIEENKKISALAAEMCKKYAKGSYCVVPLPRWLRNTFKQAGLEKDLQNRIWTWERFYQEVVFKNLEIMDPKSRDTLVLHAIDLNSKEIDSLLICHPCIPTTNGNLQYIKKLVSPEGRVACLFDREEGCLLEGTQKDFRSPKRTQRLLELGMAKDNLPLEDITQKAGTMTSVWSVDQKKVYERLKCILELLKSHKEDSDSVQWTTLRDTAFLPAFSPGDIKKERSATLKRPTAVFSDTCSLLVNMTHHVLDHTGLNIHSTDPILELLGVHNNPEPEMVIQQLQETCKQSQSTDTSMLPKIVFECYKFLDQCVSGCENTTLISQQANSFPFIFTGNRFVNVTCVAEKEQFEARPYLHVLPPVYARFRNLWKTVGVEEKFSVSQFLTVLQKLQSQHGKQPLPKSDLSICLTILSKGIFEAEEKTADDCLIPNVHGVLQPAKELFYNDSPWMPVASDIALCHENIPRVMACHFGIKTTKHHTLDQCTAEISPYAFHFAQNEDLTVRIKNILSAYPSKKDILKELIQNADDAEATEIHFVWDKRQHDKEKTFGERWNGLQGPSLCVFNNKVFSDEDLVGIQQLGEGGKQNLQGKIGKYGLGFNSVYHLTDCPSIVTGDKLLCIFDPNKKYIESQSDKPLAGIGYHLAETFKDMYMDVYKTFLPDKFSLQEGTMFRLPLRRSSGVENSKISHHEVTDNDMHELCSALSEDPEGLILFLKNICKVQVHEINENSGNLKTIFVVEKHLPQGSKEQKQDFAKHLENALKSEKAVTLQKTFYQTTISTSDNRKSEWMIAEQFGSFKENDLQLTDKLPQAAIAARLSVNGPNPSQSSKGDFEGTAFCSLPLPGKTGLPVHVNGNFEVDSARKSLWKEDGQSLKLNWNKNLKQNIVAPLYADLLNCIRQQLKAKTTSYLSIQSYLKHSYFCFWPIMSHDVGQEWHGMIREVYKSIEEKVLDVIPVLTSLKSKVAGREIKAYRFDWCSLSGKGTINAPYLTDAASETVTPILESLGMKLVPSVAYNIWRSFRSAGVEVKNVSPTSVCTFLKAKPLNDPTQTDSDLPLPVAATLIKDEQTCSELLKFCLADAQKVKAKNVSTLLDGLPLLLTKTKVLSSFNSKSPMLISRYDNLFIGFEDIFADYKINNEYISLLQTVNLVEKMTLPRATEYLKPIMQHLLQSCEVDPDSGLFVPDDTMTKWLDSFWWFISNEITFTPTASDQCLTLSDVRKLFSDCCILPVRGPDHKRFLQKMKNMSSVIPFVSDKDMSHILIKLGFMQFNYVFFSSGLTQLTSGLQAELMNVNDKSAVLNEVCNINHSQFCHLSMDETNTLQNFLQSGLSKSQNCQDYEWKLKSLPIFETTEGERVTINGPKGVYVLSCTYRGTFPDLFSLSSTNSIFLKCSSENFALSQMLGIKIMNDLEYFMKFILPAVHTLKEKEILDCLMLLMLLDFSQHKDQIIASMKSLKLICSSQGRLELASYYFDDTVELYKKMMPQERFVPKTFWTNLCKGNEEREYKARSFVKALGMKHDVSTEDIINFAKQLEAEARGNGKPEELKKKSTSLFKEALGKVSRNKDENLLRSISNIKFIFPVKIRGDLCNYHKSFATENTTVQIRGSLIDKDPNHQQLIWSSMPIIHLPIYITQELKQMMKNVGAHEQPPSQYVTTNMRNICQSPCKNEQQITARAEVFRHAYAYLQANDFDGQSLAGLPAVLVEDDTQLFKADDVCLSLEFDLDFRPYLYKITSKDAMFAEFFKKIGVKKEATAVHYSNVLAAVYADSCDKKHPHEKMLLTVRRAVHQLFCLMKTHGNQVFTADCQTLHLPAVDGKLYPSNSLYYNDTVFEVKRLEEALEGKFLLLEKLSKCHLGKDVYEHHRLVQLLPQRSQPKMLSQITEEQLVEPDIELCELGDGCEFGGWFEKHLSSRAFKHGLICLLRHQSQGNLTQQEETKMFEKIFGCIQIVCCKSLATVLCLSKQPLPRTARETDVYVKREESRCVFHLKHNDNMAPKVLSEVNMFLAKEIIALLNYRISSSHLTVLGHLLMCDDLDDVKKTLARNNIRDSAETESGDLNSSPHGSEIPEEWYDSLDMSFLNNFELGEYVGYSINNKYIYAIIVEEFPGLSGRCSQRYTIDIGDDQVKASHLDLYQFKRGKKKPRPEDVACSSSMELVLVEGAVPHSSQTSPKTLPSSLDEAKKEIDECLAQIWSLTEDERRKGIRRLYLRWHPDKNPDCQSLATEAVKYLQNRVNELSRGKGSSKSGSASYSSGTSAYSNFYQQWDQEARHHRSGRERHFRNHRSYNFWAHNTNIPKPEKEEAQRWFKQARCDLHAAQKDTGEGSTEWCLFKVHQAVEKALIAVELKRSGTQLSNSSILVIAAKVSSYHSQLRDLPEIVQELKKLGVDAKKTQYPNYHPNPRIPNEQFRSQDGITALNKASELLRKVEVYIS
uniref:HEPN domain-containing protein n=1 Tax=Nothobranchius furzeri TaxID=105023 RepID=A0A8C6Q6H5_NOTFU